MNETNETGSRTEPIQLTISGLINDLRNGITRCEGDLGYDKTKGSIQEKYNLTKSEVKEIFKNPKLAGIKVKIAKEARYILTDDTAGVSNSEPTKFGAPTASAKERLAKADAAVTKPLQEEGTTNSTEVPVGEQDTAEVNF